MLLLDAVWYMVDADPSIHIFVVWGNLKIVCTDCVPLNPVRTLRTTMVRWMTSMLTVEKVNVPIGPIINQRVLVTTWGIRAAC